MGLTTGEFPPVDPKTFMDTPYRDRLKVMARHWGEYGFGAPKITAIIYIVKLLVLHVGAGLAIATLTSGLNPFHFADWWREPIVWQKFLMWTVLLETVGLAGSWGPLAGHFKPMTGGILYYARLKTIRVPPWPDKVPGTAGDERTPVDVGIYLLLVVALIAAIVLPGSGDSSLDKAIGSDNEGLVSAASIIPVLVLLGLLGLRDKIAFLAARSEQYIPPMVFFAFFPFVDMIVAAKVFIVCVWVGAAFSKLGKHFIQVIPPMVSNTPWLSSRKLKRMHYRDFPEDMRPSEVAVKLTHAAGTAVEAGAPLVMLFSQNTTVTIVAACLMIGFHVFIISTFPLAVPLDWNALFIFLIGFLFLGHQANAGYGLGDIDPALLVLVLATSLVFPVLGNLRPDLVSFLPSMRQYAGNWASAMWAFAPGGELKLDEHVVKPALMQRQQLVPLYGDDEAEVIMQQLLGWRALHSQGRGMNSVMMNTLGPDIDTYTLREAEFSCNALTGFNFGDGHFHDDTMIAGLQRRCQFAPGEFVVVWVESEPFGNGRQQYHVIDAAVGVIERGSWSVADAVAEQPWLPNGPIATEVTWRLEGYERQRHGEAAATPTGRFDRAAEGARIEA